MKKGEKDDKNKKEKDKSEKDKKDAEISSKPSFKNAFKL